MINKKQIKELANRVVKGDSGLKSPVIMHPTREWAFGLVVMVMVFISCASWSAKTYFLYKDVSVSEARSGEGAVTMYRESLIHSALESLEGRIESNLKFIESVSEPIVMPEADSESEVTSSSSVGSLEGVVTASTSVGIEEVEATVDSDIPQE